MVPPMGGQVIHAKLAGVDAASPKPPAEDGLALCTGQSRIWNQLSQSGLCLCSQAAEKRHTGRVTTAAVLGNSSYAARARPS